MIFKHINAYRLKEPVDAKSLAIFLDEKAYVPCLPSEEQSAGFGELFGLSKRVFTANSCHLFNLSVEEKLIPPAAVNALYKKKLLEEESGLGRKLKKQEREELKESIRYSMIPKAFSRIGETWAYIDNKAKLLVINSASPKTADGIAQAIRSISPKNSVFPVKPQHDISSKMTFWVSEDQAPVPFTVGDKCEISDGEGTIKYDRRSLEDNNLRSYLSNDLYVTSLSLSMSERCEFVLTSDFMIKSFRLTDAALEDLDFGSGEPLEIAAADLTLLGNEVRGLLENLLNVLGGEDLS